MHPDDRDPDAPRLAAVDRRALLRKGAIGAGVVWASPVILSTAAGATGSSCGSPQLFTWGGGAAVPGGVSAFSGWNAGTSNGGVGLTVDYAVGSGTTGSSVRGPNAIAMGGESNNFSMQKINADPGTTVTLTITFSLTVLGLDFTLLDVDRASTSDSHYLDRVTVRAVRPDLTTTVNPTNVYLGVSPTSTIPATPVRVGGTYPTYEGTGDTAQGVTNSNVRFVWPNTPNTGVRQVSITYTSVRPTGCSIFGFPFTCPNSTQQFIGISAIRFC